ncbi:IS256 family transposase [Tautonia rosea]|uniref:IS256 family transposase n=1 Tax=Tautonia rosea TaxID=2728037 RepID=UPI0014746F45|nr:IS256 family transposase [Tautonia rosea]
MSQRYHVVDRPDSRAPLDPRKLAQVLAQDGQLLLPMLDLIEHAEAAVDDLIDVMGRATIEAVLLMSAAGVAGPKQQGKRADRDVVYHGSQAGRVALKERQLRVTKPRLRKRAPQSGEPGEVEVPAYEAMRKDGRLADRMLEILIAGVSTRRYEHVLPEMAETVGVSKSEVSREAIEAGERLLKGLAERDLSGPDILAVWIDGIQLGPYHVICAVGVDADSHKHVLGLREGATENSAVATALLEDLVRRGLDPERRRLFIIDGAKALRAAIDRVFGADQPVQRCRNHKLRNVTGHLPKDQHEQAKATLRAAFKLDAKEGMAKLEQYASWLEHQWPDAAGSLREGLEEMFTINRLGLPSLLRRCLGTTNLIDNGHSAARDRMRRVRNWQSGSMALRWTAAAFDAASKGFRRIIGYEHIWMLKAALEEPAKDRSLVQQAVAG